MLTFNLSGWVRAVAVTGTYCMAGEPPTRTVLHRLNMTEGRVRPRAQSEKMVATPPYSVYRISPSLQLVHIKAWSSCFRFYD